MQREIGNSVQLRKTISAFESVRNVPSIDRNASDFDTAREKVKKVKRFIDRGEYDADVARYIPKTLELAYQGMLEQIKTVDQVAHPSYKDKETFYFQLLLDKNHYTNLNSLHICFPIRIRKATDATAAIEANMITVNNFFAHWIKEITKTKYGRNKQLIPTSALQEIYQYSDAVLKHLPEKSLKKINDFLYSEKPLF